MSYGTDIQARENSIVAVDSLAKGYSDIIFRTLNEVVNTPIDYEAIPQSQLDLTGRGRVNLFPWRGQFSPELIENLLDRYARPDTVVFDPFCGCGTTLFESARRSLACVGTEVNPAAIEMANTVKFTNLSQAGRESYIRDAQNIIEANISKSSSSLSKYIQDGELITSENQIFKKLLEESAHDSYMYNIITNTLIRHYSLKHKKTNSIFDAFKKHANLIRNLPYSTSVCEVYHCDARKTPVDRESIDLIITSPPYINVFNYHQQYREVMELAGWDLLKIAKLEIGSNRKNRGNRFLTAIQYSIDMFMSLSEMKQVLKPDGRIIIVIGRESNIRKISLENYKILSALAIDGIGLRLDCRHERKFINRFGRKIYEDILVFSLGNEPKHCDVDFARAVAVYLLKGALNRAEGLIKDDIELAITEAFKVLPSPTYDYRTMRSITYEFNTTQR